MLDDAPFGVDLGQHTRRITRAANLVERQDHDGVDGVRIAETLELVEHGPLPVGSVFVFVEACP